MILDSEEFLNYLRSKLPTLLKEKLSSPEAYTRAHLTLILTDLVYAYCNQFGLVLKKKCRCVSSHIINIMDTYAVREKAGKNKAADIDSYHLMLERLAHRKVNPSCEALRKIFSGKYVSRTCLSKAIEEVRNIEKPDLAYHLTSVDRHNLGSFAVKSKDERMLTNELERITDSNAFSSERLNSKVTEILPDTIYEIIAAIFKENFWGEFVGLAKSDKRKIYEDFEVHPSTLEILSDSSMPEDLNTSDPELIENPRYQNRKKKIGTFSFEANGKKRKEKKRKTTEVKKETSLPAVTNTLPKGCVSCAGNLSLHNHCARE